MTIGHVEDMEQRLEILRLWREYDLAHKRVTGRSPEADELYEEYKRKLEDARRWYDHKIAAMDGNAEALAACKDAQTAYFAAPLTIRENDEGEPIMCAVTRAPIMEEDEVVETESGALILASAFIPRSILDQFKDADDEADEVSEFVEDAA